MPTLDDLGFLRADSAAPAADDAGPRDQLALDAAEPSPPAAAPGPALGAAKDLGAAKTLALAGAGLQSGAALGAGAAAWYAGRTNRSIAGFNARIAEYKAVAAANRGIFQANESSRRAAQIASAQTTATAANGVVAGSGTAAAVAESTRGLALGDAADARLNALMEAWGYRSAAGAERMRGDLDAAAGTQALIGGGLGAIAAGATGFYRTGN